jgi:hypothetical protein
MQNSWQIGTLYQKGGAYFGAPGGQGFGFTQTGGPGTQVLPAQTVDPSSNIAPFSTKATSNQTGQFAFGCGHIVNNPVVWRDFDYVTNMSAAMITCPMCGYLNSVLEPYELWLNTFTNPIQLP